MEEIIRSIKQAEEEAVSIKERALKKSREIVDAAEQEAGAMVQSAEVKRKNDRDTALRVAREKADAEYEESVEKSRKEAKAYADECLKKIDRSVKEIVRRIVSGDC